MDWEQGKHTFRKKIKQFSEETGNTNAREGGHKLNSPLFLSLIPNPLPSLSVLDIISQGVICSVPASEAPGKLVIMQAIGSCSRCGDFDDLGVSLRIFLLQFPRQFLKMYTDVYVSPSKALHAHSSCLSSGLTISYLVSSSCLVISPPSSVSPLSASPLLHHGCYANCHAFQTLTLVYLSGLWIYEIFSLTMGPSHSHSSLPNPFSKDSRSFSHIQFF